MMGYQTVEKVFR